MKHNWNDEKNQILKEERHISFEDILETIRNDGLIGIEPHYNKEKYGHQSVMFVNIRNYVYLVPFVYDREREEVFLKTIIPSRKHTKRLKEQL